MYCSIPGSWTTSPKPLTHTDRLGNTTPNSAAPHGAAAGLGLARPPLPPYHSKGQPHGPGVVDDVSSHLGLQEGAFGQAPVLVGRDLLGRARERDQSAMGNHSHLLPARKQVISSSCDYQVEGGSGTIQAAPEGRMKSSEHSDWGSQDAALSSGKAGHHGGGGTTRDPGGQPWGGSYSPRLRASRQTHDSLTVKAQALESGAWVRTLALLFMGHVIWSKEPHFSEP